MSGQRAEAIRQLPGAKEGLIAIANAVSKASQIGKGPRVTGRNSQPGSLLRTPFPQLFRRRVNRHAKIT